jgi:Sulfotransferase family
MKSPIFIVGPHRSGSTFWHNLVAMCPGILRLADPRFLSRPGQRDFRFFLHTQARDLSTDEDIKTMVELCLSKKSIAGLEGAFWRFEGIKAVENSELRKEIARRIKESDRSLGAIARIMIEEITRISGYDRACVKFPVDVGHILELVEWFPDCKIVHITRDPRALAMSKSNDPSGTAIKVVEHPRWAWFIRKVSVWLTIVQYRLTAKLHVRFKELSNYRLFRYEDLLAEPERVLRELCEFIETDFTEDMLEPQKGRHEHQPSSLTGKRQKAFDPRAATRWRTVISRVDYWLITSLTHGSMKKLGYNPKTHPIFRKVEQFQQPVQRQAVF